MIYLASQSPRRKEILQKLRFDFRVVASSYEEKHKKKSPAKLVAEHAVGKVRGVSLKALMPLTLEGLAKGKVLGADTLVYSQGKVLGKPKNQKQAIAMLESLSGRAHFVYTGIAVLSLKDGKIRKGFAKTKVFVKKLTRLEMLSYIKAVNSYDKAGAYAIQMTPKIVTRIEGSYSNVVGLPEELVKKLLNKRTVQAKAA